MKTELATLLDRHSLTTTQAAAMLGRHPCTVRKWRAGIEPAPPWALELLALKMERKQ